MALNIIDFLTMSILPIYEHIYLSIYLNPLPFLSTMSYSCQCIVPSLSWLNLLPSILYVFDTIGIEIVFFISFSDISLLVYKNMTDFYILVFYPVTLAEFVD